MNNLLASFLCLLFAATVSAETIIVDGDTILLLLDNAIACVLLQ